MASLQVKTQSYKPQKSLHLSPRHQTLSPQQGPRVGVEVLGVLPVVAEALDAELPRRIQSLWAWSSATLLLLQKKVNVGVPEKNGQ